MKLGQKRPHQGALKTAKNSTLADFNQIWYKASPDGGELKFAWKKLLYPLWAPSGGKRGKNWINLKKSSSHEPLVLMMSYLIWRVLRARSTKFANENEFGLKNGPTRGRWKWPKIQLWLISTKFSTKYPPMMENWSLHEKSSCAPFGPLQEAKKGPTIFFHIFYFFSRTTG